MSFLPERTILGHLEIIEVYDFYDKPVLFSCKNKSGLTFIVLCVDSLNLAEVWLYSPVSSSRFENVIKGEVELRDIFVETEDAFVYQVEIPYEDGRDIIVKNIQCNEIPDEYLPELGQFIQSEFQNIEIVSTYKREIL